ncbi:MAG: ATP-binding protein [Hyphomonadaceae bacterium]|nr:ATP-binding protein [Hyphomonadaceae bacterium]
MARKLAASLGEFDIRERLAPRAPVWLVQIGFAFVCIFAEIVVRALINQVFPGAAPFALIYPAILAASLFAGWQSGLIVLAISELLAWYFVLPVVRSFTMANAAADGPRLVVIFLSGLIVIFLASAFRGAVRSAARLRNAQLSERDLLLREIEHRTKNNFAMVSGLIDMQRRRADNEEVKTALTGVLARIESFSRAHTHLHHAGGDVSAVEMRNYITDLGEALAQALTLQGDVTLSSDADDTVMDRDRAVTIGLLINELVTNAAKHAFEGRDRGAVEIKFRRIESGWRLTVADDGIGIDPAKAERAKGGLGQRLVDAFARQANGTLNIDSDATGTRVHVDFKA